MKRTKGMAVAAMVLFLALSLSCGDDDVTGPGDGEPGGTTALTGDDGLEAPGFSSFEQVSLSLSGLEPLTRYTIEVRDGGGTLVGRYDLVTDGNGEMDASSVLYDPEPGTYTLEVLGTGISFTFSVDPPAEVYYHPCDDEGTHVNNVTVGDPIYLTAANGTAGTTVHVYVTPNRYDWDEGDYLYDYTETVEELVFDANGDIPPTTIWEATSAAEGNTYDVVVDVNRNGVYDQGDYLDGQVGVGFVVQQPDLGLALVEGHVIERLSSDVNYVYRDIFHTDENVYVYLNPVAKMRNLGGDRYVTWYIVVHKDTWNDGDALAAVTTTVGDAVQAGCTNAGRRLLWPGPLQIGDYDVVVDVDNDGLYDMGQDILDGYSGEGSSIGFTVIGEPETREWTLLVYADGEGNLSGTRSQYANEIAANMDDDMYAAVLFDGDDDNGYTDCKRYVCTPGVVTEDRDFGELNMGHPLTLHDFLTWGITRFPANHYCIVLSDHGGSWFNETHPVPNELWYDLAICYDNNYSEALNMYELEAVFRDLKALVGGKLDVIWYQGCLMGGIEIAAVSKDYFDYMVSHETVRYGSENTDKFPNVVTHLRGNQATRDLAHKMVDAPTAPTSSYCAAYDLSQYGAVESAVTNFVNVCLDQTNLEDYKGDILALVQETRRIAPPGEEGDLEPFVQNGDMHDFFERVANSASETIPAEVKQAASSIPTALGPLVSLGMGNEGGDPGLHGTAIWLPETAADFSNHAGEYSGFDFSARTRWPNFLGSLYGVAYRVELTWGSEPSDLDSHLWDAQDPPNHVVYHCMDCIPGAYLDLDDVTSYGPENVRISYLTDGPLGYYQYNVRLYSGSQSEEVSTVKVFRGGSQTPAKTYHRRWNDDNRGWHVFNIETPGGDIVDVDVALPDVPNLGGEGPAKSQ